MENTSSGEPKNLLCISTVSDYYGAERSLMEVVRRLGPGWRVRFLLPGPGRYASLLQTEGYAVSFLRLRYLPGIAGAAGMLLVAFRLWLLIRRYDIRLVHINLHFAAPLVSLSSSLNRVPLVVHVRNMETRRPGPLFRFLFRRAAAYVCISRAVARSLRESELLTVAGEERVHIIPDGRELTPFGGGNGDRVRRELGIGPAAPLVTMIARIEPMKGQDLFLRMAAIVAAAFPDSHFLIAGDVMDERERGYQEELLALRTSLGLDRRITFSGYRSDIPDVFGATTCLVHPARRGAFVSVLIEALAAGVPVVASDVDGIPECLGRDGAAELVAPVEPERFAAAVAGVLADGDRAARMARLGRERAHHLFAIGPLARQTEEVFKCIAGE